MNYKIHLYVGIGLAVGTFLGVAWYFFTNPYEVDYISFLMNLPLIGFLMAIIAIWVAILVVTDLWNLVPVKCPSENCDGKAYGETKMRIKGEAPIIYKCSKCGYVHDTGVWAGWQ